MKRTYAAVAGFLGSVIVVAGIFSGLAGAQGAEPSPTSTASIPISVVIPQVGPTPSPSSTSTPSNSGGGSGSGSGGSGSGGGSAGGTCTPVVGDAEPAAPSAPLDKAGALALDPETVAVDDWIVGKASGYTPGEKVQVAIYPGATVVDSYKADTSGNVVVRFRVPEETRPGDHILQAVGWNSCVAAKADFAVVAGSAAAAFPYLWWVGLVVAVLVAAIIISAIYFRRSIRRSFTGGLAPESVT